MDSKFLIFINNDNLGNRSKNKVLREDRMTQK